MTNIHAQTLGRLGGQSRSRKKIEAARKNLAQGRAKRWEKNNKNNP